MNYLYFIFMGLIISVSSFLGSNCFPTESTSWHGGLIVIGVISSIIILITLIVSIADTLILKQNFREYCNQIREQLADIQNLKNDIDRYKEEFTKVITEMYPQYEKEVFRNMQPQDIESLSVIMVKYPELKFDGVLNGYIKNINTRFTKIMECEGNINYTSRLAKDIQESRWMFGVIDFPNDLK